MTSKIPMSTSVNGTRCLCRECGKSYSRLYIHKHMKLMHVHNKHLHCRKCNKTFANSDTLDHHMLGHNQQRVFECDECPMAFYYNEPLMEHKKKHGKYLAGQSCKICGAFYEQSNAFLMHMQIHSGENKNYCTICRKSFIRADFLTKHMRSHAKEIILPFVCKMCNFRSAHKQSLDSHMSVHRLKNKMVWCNSCNLSFPNQELCQEHLASHVDMVPILCSNCNLTFYGTHRHDAHKAKCRLVRELKQETTTSLEEDIKPVICELCCEAFQMESQLQEHILLIHENVM